MARHKREAGESDFGEPAANAPEGEREAVARLEEELKNTRAQLREAEEALQRRERIPGADGGTPSEAEQRSQELERVLDAMVAPVVVFDAKGTVVKINAAARKLCDIDPTGFDARGWDWFVTQRMDARHLDGRPVAPSELPVRRALRGEPQPDLMRLRPADGRGQIVIDGASCPLQRGGRIVGAVSAWHEITEQLRAQDALREEQSLLRAVIETIADPVYIKDSEGRFVLANAAVLSAMGKPVEQVLGRTDLEIYGNSPNVRPIVANDRRVMQSGSVQVVEETVPTPRGPRVMLNTKAPRRDPSGRIIGLVGVARDITDRKRAEESLRESESRFRSIADSSPVLMWLTDAEGELLFVNRTCRDYFGLPRDSAGADWRPFVHSEDANRWGEFAGAVREQRTFVGQLRVRRSDGEWRWLATHAEPRFSASGEFLGHVGAGRDITEAKRASDALREADRRKNEFLAMLSHELRNPLAPIRNSLYILDRAAPGGEQARRAHRVIDRQTAHMARLIDDLLDVTRISHGKISLQRERLELGELVQRTIEDHRSLFQDSGISLEPSLPDERLWVDGDATRLAQVVGNLLQNAAKFTGRGGSTSVTLRRDAATGQAVITVRDTGVGLGAEMLPHLFEPFSQADRTLDRSRGGLGLGLALVKGVVELHGGTVAARSEGPGQGAEFTVRLPLQQRDLEQAEAAQVAAPATGRRVLLIEDNLDSAETLREALELMGHQVEVAHDGPEGIAMARRRPPEVVLCDIGLPGMDGYQVARALRADETFRGAVLVALTGYAGPDDQQRAARAGFWMHLAKPPSMAELEEVLATAPRAGEAQPPEAGPPSA